MIGGGTLSTTDFFRRRKKDDFLFTTWRVNVLVTEVSFFEDCFPPLMES